MKLHAFRHDGAGWSVDELPKITSDEVAIFVFGGSNYFATPEPIIELSNRYPSAHLVGCSSAGEIFGTQIWDDSLSVAIAEFDKTRVGCAFTPVASAAYSYAAGMNLAGQLVTDDLAAIIVLSDGLNVNGSELVRGINAIRPEHVVVTGGLAADGDRFERTWTIEDGKPATGWVSAIGLYGNAVRVGHGSKGGWDLFGPERRVTRSEGNVLYKLDDRPALELYKEYLGQLADGLPATGLLFPLALRAFHGDEKQLVRTILAVDEAEQALVFAGDVPEGHLAQLMQANFDRIIGGAALAARQSGDLESTHECLAIAISCVGRRLVLGERAEEETEATLDALPDGTHQVGFYSYGEISPYTPGTCELHNQTMTLTTICEV